MKTFQQYLDQFGEIGVIEEVMTSIGIVAGLPGVHATELVVSEDGQTGLVLSLEDDRAEVLFFSEGSIKANTKVARTGEILQVPVCDELLGRTITPFGFSISGRPLKSKSIIYQPLFKRPAGIQQRKRITKFFETGVGVVDMMVPLGKGQRELIIGDRKTGKTEFLFKTIETQAQKGMICIYAAIGKKTLDIKKTEELFTQLGIMQNLVIVASSPNEAASVIYLTPYTAITIAEYFRDQGKDVLVILDDLSTHARSYREISLLSKRFPGRNSYPGDIFHTHAQIVERAGNFITKNGNEVSLTCLPVVESTEGDMVGYIQTNLMSMTDGHLYFDNDLFAKGRRPAVNPFLSVTRVGHQTQTPLMREVHRELTSFLTLYERMQAYTHFGAEVTESVRQTLHTGERIVAFFNQERRMVIPQPLQIFLFSLIWTGAWQLTEVSEIRKQVERFVKLYTSSEVAKKTIDQAIASAPSLNTLIGHVSKNKNEYLKMLTTLDKQK